MLIAVVPLLVLILGALVYALSGNAKVAEMGRLAFFTGLFVLVWVAARETVRLL